MVGAEVVVVDGGQPDHRRVHVVGGGPSRSSPRRAPRSSTRPAASSRPGLVNAPPPPAADGLPDAARHPRRARWPPGCRPWPRPTPPRASTPSCAASRPAAGLAEALLCGVTTVADHHLTWPAGADTVGDGPGHGRRGRATWAPGWSSSAAPPATTPRPRPPRPTAIAEALVPGRPDGVTRGRAAAARRRAGRGAQRRRGHVPAAGGGRRPVRAAPPHPEQRAGRRRRRRRALRPPAAGPARRLGLAGARRHPGPPLRRHPGRDRAGRRRRRDARPTPRAATCRWAGASRPSPRSATPACPSGWAPAAAAATTPATCSPTPGWRCRSPRSAAGALAARDVLEMATAGSAAGLGRPELGHLRPGAAADLCVWDVSGVADAGVADPVAGLLWAAPGAPAPARRRRPAASWSATAGWSPPTSATSSRTCAARVGR